ncbi:MAG: hypothetical protein R2716_00640 [Microthrixaceae bacterium]
MSGSTGSGDLGVRSLRRRDVDSARRRGSGSSHTVAGRPGGARLADIERVGDWIRILRVGRPEGFSFTAGQYLKVGADGSRTKKFSIASAPGDELLEFCIGLNPGGTVTPRLFSLEPGWSLELAPEASGSLALDESAEVHLMVATTTGIAPIRSMVRHAMEHGSRARFTILHGASLPADLPYRHEFDQLASAGTAVSYVPTVSRPEDVASAGWRGSTGRVEALALREMEGLDPSRSCVYACGNDGMVANVRRAAEDRGLDVRTESFG